MKVLMHNEVFIPSKVVEICKNLQQMDLPYNYSNHLSEHFSNPNYKHSMSRGDVEEAINNIYKTPITPFEVELDKDVSLYGDKKWRVSKYVVRVPIANHRDMSVVIRPKRSNITHNVESFLIVTAWLNDRDDVHSTLDASKYINQEGWNSK